MIKSVTGTKDILPSEIPKWKFLEEVIKRIFASFNYKEIRTPVFEETSLFARSIGEQTDIVGKEMYTFLDKSETSLTLKPEMTASVVRAFIQHSLGKQQSLSKLFYISSMFRQERPQAGRLREFHQFGAEAIGSSSPLLDVEMILMSFEILKSLGLKNISVRINSLGIPESREKYKSILKDYLDDKKNKLSEDSRKRLGTNILRIFDSKEETDQKIMKAAPSILDYLDIVSKDDFEIVKENLSELNIPFEVDPKLVRGLDYYTKTTFEIISANVGSQSALVGGGRYDLLVEHLEGDSTPGVGFAAGMDRILLACENENVFNLPKEQIDLYVVKIETNLLNKVFKIVSGFRKQNYSVEMDYLNRSVKAQMREANRLNARFVLLVGGDEYKSGNYKLKNMKSGEEKLIRFEDLNDIKLSA
jgi:histidyl-tRNA synthetase